MFKKSRIKIIIYIMSVLVLLLAGTVGIIYISSYMDVYSRSQDMLERYVEKYSVEGENIGDINTRSNSDFSKHDDGLEKGEPDHLFQLTTFYSVAFSGEGDVLRVDNNGGLLYSEDELVDIANNIVEKNREKGSYRSLYYRVKTTDDYVLVAFMDKAVMDRSIVTLLQYTALFGAVGFVGIFILSLVLSKRIVEPLEEMYKKQKQFISDAGHELKTPVSVISTNADMLANEIGENQWLANIQYENEKMAVLIKQLMELAKTENVTPDMQQLDFSRIVIGELLSFESVAYEKGVRLIYDNVAQGITVNGDASQLSQLVSILIDNAINHSEENSNVTVSLAVKHSKVIFEVANRGGNISDEEKELIFERFYQSEYSRSCDDNHYGLGLAIAKAVANSHHADISVASENGIIKFTVSIPL